MIGKKHLRMKQIVLAAGLVAGATGLGVARADDSSLNPFTGESYAAFNGGDNRPAVVNPAFDTAPSAWRQANPNGLSERVLESYSAPGEAWHLVHPAAVAVASDPDFKQTHPSGLTQREYQALSSDAAPWQLSGEPGSASVAATEQATPQQPLGARLANLFHRNANSATQ
jgi:hypothetical protein